MGPFSTKLKEKLIDLHGPSKGQILFNKTIEDIMTMEIGSPEFITAYRMEHVNPKIVIEIVKMYTEIKKENLH